MLHSYLLGEQFEQSLVDPCVYTRNRNESKVSIMIWVDDTIIAVTNIHSVEEVKSYLSRTFKMKVLRQLSWFLGMHKDESDEVC